MNLKPQIGRRRENRLKRSFFAIEFLFMQLSKPLTRAAQLPAAAARSFIIKFSHLKRVIINETFIMRAAFVMKLGSAPLGKIRNCN